MAAVLTWEVETPDLLTASTDDTTGKLKVYLVAEALSGGEWDWAAWAINGTDGSVHGLAKNRIAAMRAAELAAWMIRSVPKLKAA